MKYTYYIRSLAHNSISNRVAFGQLEMAILKKKQLQAKGDKIAIYRTDEYGNTKRIG
jgi:hypothetical protein